MLITAIDLALGVIILGSMVFAVIFILDHIGGGESYFDWKGKL